MPLFFINKLLKVFLHVWRILSLILVLLMPLYLLTGCISYEQLGLSKQQWQAKSLKQQADLKKAFKIIQDRQKSQKSQPMGTAIRLTVAGGSVMMPPFIERKPYQSASMAIPEGVCKNLELRAKTGDQKVGLTACYLHHMLALDPSHYQIAHWQGTLFFYDNPLWEQGLTYLELSTQGYARLDQANITIKCLKREHEYSSH